MKKKKDMKEEVHTSQENELNDTEVTSEEINNSKDVENASVEDQKKDETITETKEEDLAEKIAALQDKHLRLSAEFDNFRKRTLKEKADLIKTAGEGVLINILPVIDDFERALQFIDKAEDIAAIKEGIGLIHNKFKSFLSQNGVKEIEAKDKDFDTDLHEAITKFPAPSPELKGKVVDVVEKGYSLNEKVIRHSKVVVGE